MHDGREKIRRRIRNVSAPTYLNLNQYHRRRFARQNFGFLSQVQRELAQRGIVVSLATVTRTWYGNFRAPNPEVVDSLDAAYHRLREEHQRNRRLSAA